MEHTMTQYLLALLKLAVSIVVGALVAWVAHLGWTVPADLQVWITGALTAAGTAAVTIIVGQLEKWFPWIGRFALIPRHAPRPVTPNAPAAAKPATR